MEYNYKSIDCKFIKSKRKLMYKLLLILFFSSFIYSNVLRVIIKVQTNIDVRFSILTMAFLLLLLCICSKYIRLLNFNIFILIGVIQICSTIYFSTNITSNIAFISTIWTPLIMLCIEINDDFMDRFFNKIVNIYNILIVVLTIFIVIDYLTKGSLQLFMSNFLDGTSYQRVIRYEQSSGIYRAHTILGHSLTTAYYYLIFLGINMIYINHFKKECNLSKNIILLVSIIGLFLSNSKFALILSFLLFVVNIKNSKIKIIYIYGLVAILFFLISTPYFKENIVARFVQAIELGDITNGRLTALSTFLKSGNKFNFLLGNGMWSSDNLLESLGTNNFEMPIFMFAYDYGILSTILILYLVFIHPNIILIRDKKYYTALILNIIFLFGNSYNGFAVGLTTFQMYIFITFILINISKPKTITSIEEKVYKFNRFC